ncbi:MAG: DUF4417 domain-containing protein [Salinivirgaceae bacterium]|nr:DUF4417 domain-containing protein [Salinivirgaceae bacterium]
MEKLFSEKEMYVMAHTAKGKPTFIKEPHKGNPMYKYDNMHLSDGMEMVEYHGLEIPLLKPYTGTTELDYQPYSLWKKLNGEGQAVHFFMNDNEFRTAVWNKLEQTTYNLRKFDVLLTPDFSMYVDLMSFYGLLAVFMTRFVGAYWQKCGYNVIPTASWSNADSFKFAFVGLPQNSVIAVCGVGVSWSPAAVELWQMGLLELEKQVRPIEIIIYGSDKLELPKLHTPVNFIIDNITKNYRND